MWNLNNLILCIVSAISEKVRAVTGQHCSPESYLANKSKMFLSAKIERKITDFNGKPKSLGHEI